MKSHLTVPLLGILIGCGTSGALRDDSHVAVPSAGATPAPGKWTGPWKEVSGGSWRAAFYYGPWQCNRRWMESCQRECASEGHVLKGCMWLADIKYDWQGQTAVLPVPIQAGTRYAIWHCCCDYSPLAPAATKHLREQWKRSMESFRKSWGEKFGDWPVEKNKHWPGHHIRDLGHGGHPTDPNNILPAPPAIHDVFTQQYPGCYGGRAPWSTVGPDLPYTDR